MSSPSSEDESVERLRRWAGLVGAPLAFLATFALCDGLSPEGRKLSAVLAAVAVLWISEAIPLPASALLGALLCIVLGVAPYKTVLANFADPVVFVYIGGFMLARAMSVHGLDRRLAIGLLSLRSVGASPLRVLAATGLATGVMSMWVSNTATTAMMLPITLGVLGAMDESRRGRSEARPPDGRRWPFAAAMMLMVAYSASVGGLGTPVGSPPNLIGIGLIKKTTGVTIEFFDWMLLAAPLVAVMGVVLLAILWRTCRESEAAAGADPKARAEFLGYLRDQRDQLGALSTGERNTLLVFTVAVALWVLPGAAGLPIFDGSPLAAARPWLAERLPESAVAILAAVLLFLLPLDRRQGRGTLTWREAEQIDWGTILLFGGGMALGTLMFETGVAEALGKSVVESLGVNSLWALTAASIALAIALSETASNTASANMIIPVAVAIAQSADVSPLPPALGACLGSSFGFMMPVSTPPNAIVYSSGLVPLRTMMRAGIWFDVAGFVIIWVGLRLLCPLLGYM